jgi:hypothetical protein
MPRPAPETLLCPKHHLPMLPVVDMDAIACGRGCIISRSLLAAQESDSERWRREHGIVSREE